MLALAPATASAHARLVESTPAAAAVVAQAPPQVLLVFDDQIRPVANGIDVVDEDGRSVVDGEAAPAPDDAQTMVVPLQPSLADGDYTVRWKVVSTDGHLLSGLFAFGVGSGRPPPQAVSVDAGTDQDWRYVAARAAYFAGLLLLVGGAVYRLAVFLPALRGAGDARRMMELRERHRANQVLALSAAMALGGGWVALTLQGAAVAGVGFWDAFDHRGPVASALEATRFGREFGRGIDVAAGFTVLVALAYGFAPRAPRLAVALALPATALGIWALAAPGIAGHAGDPGRGLAAVMLDTTHIAAAAIWAGGLVQLFWVTPHATRGLPDGRREQVRGTIARRFSAIALGSVIVLVASGVARSLFELDAISQLWTTAYGRTLLVKIVLLGALVAIGYRNRQMLDRFRSLHRSVAAELVLLALVVGAVALLTNLPPGATGSRTASAAATPTGGAATIDLAGEARISVWPGQAGTNGVLAALPDAGTDAALLLPDGRSATLQRLSPGLYGGLVTELPAGRVAVQITSGASTTGATLEIGAAAKPGSVTAPSVAGPVGAGQAGDVAVAVQRLAGRPGAARLVLLAPDGSAVDDALVLVDGRPASPCTVEERVCYRAVVPAGRSSLEVVVRRAGEGEAHAAVWLPAAGAAPADVPVAMTVRAWDRLESLVAENVLASNPSTRVITHYVAQAPDRLRIDVQDGASSRIIGERRWDRAPGGEWIEREAAPVQVPDPFWAIDPTAAHVLSQTATRQQVTLALADEIPTFFRLRIERASGRVLDVHMVTAGHFMVERYSRFNSAPPVTPPA